ncbi:hypothetical protein V2J09_021662 [Rumex salicifolius]
MPQTAKEISGIMDAFVKKLVDKATKKPGSNSEALKPEDVEPVVAFHYGIPLGASMLAYDPLQRILAISTKNGQIKLLGKDNTQALLESKEMLPSKFLQFVLNQGALLNITVKNQIEVWDIDRRSLACVYDFHDEITSVAVLQHSPFIYIGDSTGNVAVLKLDQEPHTIEKMMYSIPFSSSHGSTTGLAADNAVLQILPQPTVESKRVLLVFNDGVVVLWDIRESRTIFSTGGSLFTSAGHETKKATSACWACPFGSKFVVGFSNGEILVYNISSTPDHTAQSYTQNGPITKLNLGYKLEKIPIASLKWAYADGKASRLYVMGASDNVSSNLIQVLLLNEHTESRMIKVSLQLPEPCLAMKVISSSSDQSKHNRQGLIILLGKSGNLYAYEDHLIEKYLLQSQSKSPPSNPSEIKIKLPFADSSIITSSFLITKNSSSDEGVMIAKMVPPLIPTESKQFDSTGFNGFAKIKNLYITGHNDGSVKLWDASSPIFIPVVSLKEQIEGDSASSAAITSVFYDTESRLLVSGDQVGMIWIHKFKPEPYSRENSFISLTGSSKKGSHHYIQSVKQVKVNHPVLSINFNGSSRQVAVGSEQGYVSLIDVEEATLLWQKQIPSELSPGVISLLFGSSNLQGFEKNLMVVTTKDSSFLALERDTGNVINNTSVHPKKPSRALFSEILDGQGLSLSSSKGAAAESDTSKQLFVLCAEKAIYVYSLKHAVQGIKKVHNKVKFQNASCCWASSFSSPSSSGLMLLFSCGRIEIRSLPELLLVKEITLRSFIQSPLKNSYSETTVCASIDGELLVARSDQEVTIVSLLPKKRIYGDLDFFSQVYDKNLVGLYEEINSYTDHKKETTKGIFGSVIKDLKGGKTKTGADVGAEDLRASFEKLPIIFSVPNFAAETETTGNHATEEDAELDIDDIKIDDDEEEKRKGFNMMASINKQKISSRFQSLKGKLKQMKPKQDKASVKEEPQQEKTGSIDQIKKKYGFSSSSSETTSIASAAHSKLSENLKKLQGINLRTTEMQNNAESFSSNAKDLLQAVEKNRL